MVKKNKRCTAEQSRHDEAVQKIANYFKNEGFSVTADLKGFHKPPKINGHVPDVIAIKGIERKIIEVETKQSNEVDKNQQSAFRKFAKDKVHTSFIKKVV